MSYTHGGRLRAATVAVPATLAALGLVAACGASRDPETEAWFTTATSSPTTSTTANFPLARPGVRGEAAAPVRRRPMRDTSWVAYAAVGEVPVYAEPDAPEPFAWLENPDAMGTDRVFLVLGNDPAAAWLPVYVPVRPNGTKGWVRAGDVTVAPNQYRVRISLSDHTMVVNQGKRLVLEASIGLGADSTPTPVGHFFVKELIQPPNPDGAYGAFVYGLSAFSEVPGLENFNGGEGTIGIHGTNDPGSIGANVSHGCVRVSNDVVTTLTDFLPLGTPVEIVP